MVRKGNWFSSVKKALSPNSKAKKSKKEKSSGKENPSVSESPIPETIQVSDPHPLPPLEDVKSVEVDDEQTKHAYSVAVASAAAAEAAVAAAQAAAEVVRLTTVNQFAGKSKEEIAAIKLQTAFRGYLARRALRALRGLVRLKSLVDGPTVKRQTANTLKCMQHLSRMQSQVQSRRTRMLEENRALQRQLLQKRAKELESLRMGDEWDDSLQSKEQIEASLLHKYEAAMRRERALAYSYTHQQTWKKSARPTNLLFMDPTNPQWGWSWLERWMATKPLESQAIIVDKDLNGNIGGEITKSFARHQLNSDNAATAGIPKPLAQQSTAGKKLKPPSPRGSIVSQEEDARSTFSVHSERNRRHSIGGSSVRDPDDESMASSPSVPSYMIPTQSAKNKTKLPSPLGMEPNGNSNGNGNAIPSAASAKKRLSFPGSPARPRRHQVLG
ncbi:protein IQ-DOMAIN 2-like [Andrographis paniculata]|uniref:protein IQ-DOMAIN 2-like n=1 Tax=Andrographis paniculata TaxID=175694 RepID=UPI0021E8DD48|nr:protein IQ-DOMAIN 2-like [Andrographis paniculata]XP_051137702.1 protein IQ-DOMAIN 2-like [Andrographis paniculata]XP_051137708.1 protein IQ-DOMAIN 2-like [Andrographis paniculata]